MRGSNASLPAGESTCATSKPPLPRVEGRLDARVGPVEARPRDERVAALVEHRLRLGRRRPCRWRSSPRRPKLPPAGRSAAWMKVGSARVRAVGVGRPGRDRVVALVDGDVRLGCVEAGRRDLRRARTSRRCAAGTRRRPGACPRPPRSTPPARCRARRPPRAARMPGPSTDSVCGAGEAAVLRPEGGLHAQLTAGALPGPHHRGALVDRHLRLEVAHAGVRGRRSPARRRTRLPPAGTRPRTRPSVALVPRPHDQRVVALVEHDLRPVCVPAVRRDEAQRREVTAGRPERGVHAARAGVALGPHGQRVARAVGGDARLRRLDSVRRDRDRARRRAPRGSADQQRDAEDQQHRRNRLAPRIASRSDHLGRRRASVLERPARIPLHRLHSLAGENLFGRVTAACQLRERI